MSRIICGTGSSARQCTGVLVEVPDYRPFWAITKHADVMDTARNNTVFTNWPRPVLTTVEGDELQAAAGVRTLIHLDDPQHAWCGRSARIGSGPRRCER